MAEKGRVSGASGLELVPAETGFLQRLLEDSTLDPFLRDAAQGTLAHQARTGPLSPWTGYFARRDGQWVGVCAFVDAPKDGEVEIAYGTVPGFEGQGIASAMANWLIARAFAEAEVTAVVANTTPAHNTSTRILETRDFVRDGTVHDTEIDEAWHWKLTCR